jgi:3-oxoacyl-[acyl-carrier protein] reductase
MRLFDKNIIITGASQGLGKEIAKYCLIEGASVALCARNEDDLRKATKELLPYKRRDQEIIFQAADVSKLDDILSFVHYTATNLSTINVLINNAGIQGPKNNIFDNCFDFDGWKKAVFINLFGTFDMCRVIVPYLIKNNTGKIINLSGGGATSPIPGMSAYAASKAAVVRFTETIALELKRYNIDVNAVAPGVLKTRLLDDIIENGKNKVTDEYYSNTLKVKERGGDSLNQAAELCVYLASNESNGITGKLISAVWDDWRTLHKNMSELNSDIYTLRRIPPPPPAQVWLRHRKSRNHLIEKVA